MQHSPNAFVPHRATGAPPSNEARAGAKAPARTLPQQRENQPSTAALNHVVIEVGCVMAVPTITANAPASIAAAACSGV